MKSTIKSTMKSTIKSTIKSIMKNKQTTKAGWCIIGLFFILIVVAFLYKRIKTPLIEGLSEIPRNHVIINPPENKRTYSSIWGSNKTGTGHARSMLDSPQAWSSQYNRKGQWMMINLDSAQKVAGIVIQGRSKGSRWSNQFVRNYKVSYSLNGTTFQYVNGASTIFSGNYRNNNIKEVAMFKTPVNAQYIRIYPQSWAHHMSMRAGVVLPKINTYNLITYKHLNPPENKRTYSSIWRNDKWHARSMLDSHQAWSSHYNRKGEWMTINLDGVKKVYGVVIQGRKTSRWSNQFVRLFTVKYSLNGKDWFDVNNGKNSFIGNINSNQDKIEVSFTTPIDAKYIRIYPQSWAYHMSMRAGVLTL